MPSQLHESHLLLVRNQPTLAAQVLLRQLTARFGGVAVEAEARIRSAAIPELDLIAERILTARTVEEALG